MDFLISEGESGRSADYTETKIGFWNLHQCQSSNLEHIHNGAPFVFAVGTLIGQLRGSSGFSSNDVDVLGQDALRSNGSFALVIVRSESVQVVTDASGSIPVYFGNGKTGIALGTRVQDVAASSGLTTVDEVSVADYLINGTVCYPYSWYQGVRLLPPGSVCTITPSGMNVHTYYSPSEPGDIYNTCDVREWGRRLRTEVETAIKQGLDNASTIRVLFSGGEDSRAIASLIPEEVDCTLTTVLNRRNREYELAARAARWIGRPLEWIQRPQGFYRSSIRDRIDLVGPGWDFRHTHFYGVIAEALQDADVIVGGYSADTLFKTYYMTNVDTYPNSRRPPCLRDPQPDNLPVPIRRTAETWLGSNLASEVEDRRCEHHQLLKEYRPRSAGNWHSLWPISNLRAYSSYLASRQIGLRIIEPFLFHRVYQLAAEMPDACRVDRKAFRKAFCGPMGIVGWLPDSSDRLPCLGGWPGSLFTYYRRQFRESRVYQAFFGTEEGYQKAWSPDHVGWNPVHPEDFFDKNGAERTLDRLAEILSDRNPRDFLHAEDLADGVKVRALALGYEPAQS